MCMISYIPIPFNLSRYLQVRYEDIATSPELAVELIYCWSGLGLVPPSVSNWVETNTNMPTCDGGAHRKRYLREIAEDSSFGYSYAATTEYPYSAGSDGAREGALEFPESGASEAAAAIVSMKTKGGGGGAGRGGDHHIGKKLAECLENTKESKNNPYGTRRQSAAMVSMWRKLMPGQDAQAVWEACEDSEVMDALGYDP